MFVKNNGLRPLNTVQYVFFHIFVLHTVQPSLFKMTKKAARTTAFIIQTVAPIFNRHGYIGTSMSDLTQATGLTKGAIYGNFENKESLALSAFEHNRNRLLESLDNRLEHGDTSLDKLMDLLSFYKQYDLFTLPLGGCPILNVGVDAQGNNKILAAAVRETIRDIEGKIALVLENGAKKNEIQLSIPPLQFAKQLFTMIQGAIAMSTMTHDRKYLINTLTYLEQLIRRELKV